MKQTVPTSRYVYVYLCLTSAIVIAVAAMEATKWCYAIISVLLIYELWWLRTPKPSKKLRSKKKDWPFAVGATIYHDTTREQHKVLRCLDIPEDALGVPPALRGKRFIKATYRQPGDPKGTFILIAENGWSRYTT